MVAKSTLQFASPIIVSGQLTLRTIRGRNGPFNVGRLVTPHGEFAVKDAELDRRRLPSEQQRQHECRRHGVHEGSRRTEGYLFRERWAGPQDRQGLEDYCPNGKGPGVSARRGCCAASCPTRSS